VAFSFGIHEIHKMPNKYMHPTNKSGALVVASLLFSTELNRYVSEKP